MKRFSFIILLNIAMIFTSCDSSSNGSLSGAGATFPLPFYNIALKKYKEQSSIQVNYGGIGSGGGIRSLSDMIVDFAGSDAFLSDSELEKMPSEIIHIPTCMGAIVLAYNLPNIETLNLSGELIANIYMGKINMWNDPKIAELNPGIKLPSLKISPVYRSDGSGTTYVFSYYLSQINQTWAKNLGCSKSLKWPTGLAAKGNPGVAGIIKQTEGSMGYVGSEYAFSLNMKMANLQNASGKFITPNLESISASVSGNIPKDTRVMITNSKVENAYPISCFTWFLIYKDQAYNDRELKDAINTVNFIKWMLSSQAQDMTKMVNYAPLSKEIVELSLATLESVTYNGKPI